MAKSKDQLLAKIDHLILDINTQYVDLKNANRLEGISIALLASNIDYLSAHVKALQFFEEKEIITPNVTPNTHIFTPKIVLDNVADQQETFEEITERVSVVEEKVVEEVKAIVVEPVKVEEVVIPAPVQPIVNTIVEEVKTVVVEKVEEVKEVIAPVVAEHDAPAKQLSINELIHQQKQAGVNMTQQFQTSVAQDKVVDLKVAISLNDKLLFIKDLFNGYSLAYSEAIELLNRFDSFSEADAFLQTNYAMKNSWSTKPQTVDKFYALLRKKFNS